MKNTLTLLSIVLVLINLHAQPKNDYTWVLGYPTLIPELPNTEEYGGMYMKFDEQGGYRIEPFDIFGGSVMGVANDEAGNLLFHTNGCSIFNKEHQLMENGEDINIGAFNYDMECNEGLGLFYIRSGNMTLPLPNDNSRHFLLHLRLVATSDTSVYDAIFDRLQFTEVNVAANNGLGKVLQKNQVLVADSLHDAISAVRHGNGRDWWVIMPRGRDSQFWKILLTPEGFQTPVLQTIPPPYPVFDVKFKEITDTPPYYVDVIPDEYGFESWAGQATFSPDGSKYCRIIKSGGVEIYDFDRCTGLLTFRKNIPMPPYTNYPDLPIGACGLSISPNNRYLYFNNNEGLFQFDLCEENIENSSYELIDIWDGPTDNNFYYDNFFQMRNAPDGKIYMNAGNSSHFLHVIHEPDKAGKACRFEERGVVLPRWSSYFINYFPNYRLYDWADSPCDTLGIDDPNPPVKYDFSELMIFPNPAHQQVNLYVPQCEGIKIKVWNISGQIVREEPFIPGMAVYPLDVANWPAGSYVIAAYIDNENPIMKKLIVTH